MNEIDLNKHCSRVKTYLRAVEFPYFKFWDQKPTLGVELKIEFEIGKKYGDVLGAERRNLSFVSM